jgi:hypothetical protein
VCDRFFALRFTLNHRIVVHVEDSDFAHEVVACDCVHLGHRVSLDMVYPCLCKKYLTKILIVYR